ncbi:MAG: NACHT domain-containing protein [Proteobacteria bacterium]|nr:NACHT domain-containing protein [Pseudomonadota bacterium]
MIEPTSAGVAGWLWEKYGANLLRTLGEKLQVGWTKMNWADHERKYSQHLLAEHSTTKLLGNPKEICLDEIYTDVYILDQISAFRRLDVEDMKKEQFNRTGLPSYVTRKPLLTIAETAHRLYILGKPGAGKSTFLKKVVRLCCDGSLNKTAIFISLKRWSDSKLSLLDFIAREFAICEFPDAAIFVRELLESGGAIALFDGLDEVPNFDQQRSRAIAMVSEFSRQYSNTQIMLTCRTAATEYSFDRFTYVEIADFTKDQQRSFISKWYADHPESLEQLLNEWEKRDSEALVDLARTPLLLALLCLAYDATLTFPRRRVELYEEAVNALLRKWDASRELSRDMIYKSLSHNRKEQMLRRIALETFRTADILIPKNQICQSIESYLSELPPDDVRSGIDGEAVLRAMEAQHGLLIERAHNIYSFSHLTVHEYFAAKKIIESTKSDEIVVLMRTYAVDDQWREVILMVSSLLDDGRFLIDCFVQILDEIANEERDISSFVKLALTSGQKKKIRETRYSGSRKENDLPVKGNALIIAEACVTIASNMRVLGVEERIVEIPRFIASAIYRDPSLVTKVFAKSQAGSLHAKTFFRLAALLTECLLLATLYDRQKYLRELFEFRI